nr:ubiquitin carboxyl-terminal hydrolase 51-like [Setaria viridis]
MEFLSSSSTPWCGGLHESDVGSVVFPNSGDLFHRHCSSLAESPLSAACSWPRCRPHLMPASPLGPAARPPPPGPPTRVPAAPEPRQAAGQELRHAPGVRKKMRSNPEDPSIRSDYSLSLEGSPFGSSEEYEFQVSKSRREVRVTFRWRKKKKML